MIHTEADFSIKQVGRLQLQLQLQSPIIAVQSSMAE